MILAIGFFMLIGLSQIEETSMGKRCFEVCAPYYGEPLSQDPNKCECDTKRIVK